MPAWLDISLFGLTLFFMLIGLLGLLVPVFSGILVIWLAALGYGILNGFGVLGGWMFAFITLLMLAGVTVDNLLAGAGARQGGASWTTLGVGLLAGLMGTLLFPPFGGLVGAPLAILLLEYYRKRDWHEAFQALRGLAVGFGMAFLVRFGIGLVMILLWLLWHWKG